MTGIGTGEDLADPDRETEIATGQEAGKGEGQGPERGAQDHVIDRGPGREKGTGGHVPETRREIGRGAEAGQENEKETGRGIREVSLTLLPR